MNKERPLQRYRHLVSGATSWSRWLMEEALWAPAALVPGIWGFGLRRILAPYFLANIGPGSAIDWGVLLRCPSGISIGRRVVIESQAHLLAGASGTPSLILEDEVQIRSFAVLNVGETGGFIRLGPGATVAHHCILHGHGGIDIGAKTMLAAGCAIVATMHKHEHSDIPIKDQGHDARGITIAEGVWLGAGVKVLDGVTIGKGTIVGAGSVVTESLPPFCVAAGIPAKVKKSRT